MQGPAAAGLCVIHEMLDGTLRYAGFAGTLMDLEPGGSAFVGAEKCTNGTAEIQASIQATLWALQSGYSRFRYCYDATYAEKAAAAEANPKVNHKIVNIASALRRLLVAQAESVESLHTPAHAGNPWNEFADVVCDQVSRRALPFATCPFPAIIRQLIGGELGDPAWLHLHLESADRLLAYPPIDANGCMQPWSGIKQGVWTLPDKTIVGNIDTDSGAIRGNAIQPVDGGISVVTMNVQSLRGPVKIGAKRMGDVSRRGVKK